MITMRRLENIRSGIRDRCINKKSKIYKYYGAKGITICNEWLNDSDNFKEWAINNGYDDSLEIDRIDTSGNYEPNNCRWVNKNINCANRNIKSTNKTSYIGVAYDKSPKRKKQPYRVFLRYKGKTLISKRFRDRHEAARYRENYILENELPHRLNFSNT